jgi:hypothetical protein
MSELFNTYHLFSEPSVVDGAARVFDLAGSMQIYNSHKTEAEADAFELYKDWLMVGKDILTATEKYKEYAK